LAAERAVVMELALERLALETQAMESRESTMPAMPRPATHLGWTSRLQVREAAGGTAR
jgi:hypothetical protein